jgi:hypothetical protein
MSTSAITPLPLTPAITRRVRAYFAPVNRTSGMPSIFDPAQSVGFLLDAPPAPWLDLGWIDKFKRKSGTKVAALRSGAPGFPLSQVRTEIDSVLSMEFQSWGKLQMAVTAGSEQMNLLAATSGAPPNGSGGAAAPAVAVQSGSTPTFLNLAPGQPALFTAGQMVVVDVDYTGQTGYIGSGVSGAYVSTAPAAKLDVDYVRRVSFNVARVTQVTTAGLQLAQPLIAGAPASGMQVQAMVGFVDREGSNFFQEWSGLFVIPGEQGDRVFLHYPRLQIADSAGEVLEALTPPLEAVPKLLQLAQAANFRALPVTDGNDGTQAICFRSYIPASFTNLW